jgi:hypothetical protein
MLKHTESVRKANCAVSTAIAIYYIVCNYMLCYHFRIGNCAVTVAQLHTHIQPICTCALEENAYRKPLYAIYFTVG